MSMPKSEEVMGPILDLLMLNSPMKLEDIRAHIADQFSLSEEEAQERLKTGQKRFINRVGWALSDLNTCGLIGRIKQGVYYITDDGIAFRKQHPGLITSKQMPSSTSSQTEVNKSTTSFCSVTSTYTSPVEHESIESPEEVIERAIARVRRKTADEVLDRVLSMDDYAFEELVAKLLVSMGYGSSLENPGGATKKSGDGGIDGIICEDRLGFDAICYQAKRWSPNNRVGRPDVQAFSGAMEGAGVTKGLFITTSSYTPHAEQFARQLTTKRIVLIDGAALAGLMVDYNVGVSTRAIYELKAVDEDFFDLD